MRSLALAVGDTFPDEVLGPEAGWTWGHQTDAGMDRMHPALVAQQRAKEKRGYE